MDAAPGILGVMDGPPFHPLTWSGTSRRLFSALQRRGALVEAVDAHSALIDRVSQAASFTPNRRRWWQRYFGGVHPAAPFARRARSELARRRAGDALGRADALLQIGAWYDFSRVAGPAVRCSYHDGNLATYLQRPDVELSRDSHAVRRAWDAERRLYDSLDLIMPMSAWLGRAFVEEFGQDPAKVVVVGAGANIDTLPEVPERDWEQPRLLFVGKGEFARKGGPQLLEAFAALRAEHPGAELTLIGPERPAGTQPGVSWLGRVGRDEPEGERIVLDAYTRATALVLPSIYEPFGVAFLEGMAFGLPCVGTRACAMPEIIEEGRTGRLARPGDSGSLAEELLALAADPGAARAMGAAGRRRLEEHYTWDGVAGRVVAEVARRLPGR